MGKMMVEGSEVKLAIIKNRFRGQVKFTDLPDGKEDAPAPEEESAEAAELDKELPEEETKPEVKENKESKGRGKLFGGKKK